MREALVLGIGNRLMMDDGIGLYVVEELRKRAGNPLIRYEIGETDVYYCLSRMNNALYTVIIDAACNGKKPGTICVIPLGEINGEADRPIGLHGWHLINEIKTAFKDIEGVLIGIEPFEICFHTGLSPLLRDRFLTLTGEIEGIIASLCSE